MIDYTQINESATQGIEAMQADILAFVGSLPVWVLPTRGDLILGFAFGYAPETIAPFVESVRTHGQFKDTIVLFIDPAAREMRDYLKSHNIEAISFDPAKSVVGNISLARFFAYFEFLRDQWNSGAVFDQILMTDVRDVLFQKSLFGTACEELEFQLEEPFPSIGDCPFNSAWIEAAFGKETLLELSSNNISCSGTVCGRAVGIFDYLAQMQLLVLELSEEAQSKDGLDQGLHNYILHKGLTRSATKKLNFTRVATLHYVQGQRLKFDPSGRIINPNGGMSEIAHQWDRHLHLSKKIHAAARQQRRFRRWRAWLSKGQI